MSNSFSAPTFVLVFSAPTFAPKSKPRQICINNMSPKDLAVLKKKDPFLYYSIPAIRDAKLHMKKVNQSGNSKSDNPLKVTRQSCISFECYPDVAVEDLIVEINIHK
jgi:hypothetical protein